MSQEPKRRLINPTRHQLYGHLPPIMKTIQVRQTRHAGQARTNSLVMYSYGPPHMAKQKQDDQLEHTYSSYMRIWDVALKTCQKRWMIGRSGERGSGISVLAARHDDDDDDDDEDLHVVDHFLWKPFLFFLRIFSISGSKQLRNRALIKMDFRESNP